MTVIKAHSRLIAPTVTILLVVVITSFLYWKGVLTFVNEPTPTNTPTPTPSVYELPFPEAVDIGPIPTPTNLAEWKDSTPSPNYQWTFKYPPTWEETSIPGGFGYAPKEAIKEEGSTSYATMNFFKTYESSTTVEEAARNVQIGKNNTPVLKHERFIVNGREAEMVISKGTAYGGVQTLRIITYIKDIDFNDSGDSSRCYLDGMLSVSFYYENPPTFTFDNIPYENEIKQMLSTFNITDCVPANQP